MNSSSVRLLLLAALIAFTGLALAGAAYADTCGIACSTDAACNDGDAATWDICFRPGACDSGCANLNCVPACKTNADCADNDSLTTDVCAGAQRCEAKCYNLISCGNGICDNSLNETSCTCMQDCQTCAEELSGTCTEKACIGGQCGTTIMLGCCGNGRCELGESYLSCSVDCSAETITLEYAGEEREKYLRGETLELVISVEADGAAAKGASVIANGFFGELRLYNDGSHNDGTSKDNIYGNSILLTKDDVPGEYVVKFYAEFGGAEGELSKTFVFRPELDVTLNTDAEKYFLGDIIKISGTVSRGGSGAYLPVELALSVRGRVVWEEDVGSGETGDFSAEYHSTLLDPIGEWELSMHTEDANGNTGNLTHEFAVIGPDNASPIQIEVLSGIEQNYSRGETLDLNIGLSGEGGEKLSAAIANIVLPNGKSLKMREVEQGVYSVNVPFGWDFPVGKSMLEARAVKADGENTYSGAMQFEVRVTNAKLTVDLLAPEVQRYEVGEAVEFRAKLSYPDGTPVPNAQIHAELNGKQVAMPGVEQGIYSGTYVLAAEDEGIASFVINADDGFGNIAARDLQIEVSGISPLHYLREYVVYIIVALLTLIIAGTTFAHFRVRSRRLSELKAGEARVIRQIKALQKQFFKNATIDKVNYDSFLDKYKSELADIRKSIERAGGTPVAEIEKEGKRNG
ncbi:MAG: hypothetical protein ABH854_05645 [Candidatus Diapherotrites archaeon]